MRTLCIPLSLIVFVTLAQPKFELHELKGTLKEMRSGYKLAYEVLSFEIDGQVLLFRIDPAYGQTVLKRLKPGDELTFKALINPSARESIKKMKGDPTYWISMFGDRIIEIFLDETWIPTPEVKRPSMDVDWEIVLEKIPQGEFRQNGKRKAFIFPNGFIAYDSYSGFTKSAMERIELSKPVSFMGYKTYVSPDYLYPVEPAKKILIFIPVEKLHGKIESFIQKQNFARIGLKINGKRFNFPSRYAEKFQQFTNNGEPITVYYHGEGDERSNLLPSIQAVIHGNDTLRIPEMYYGDPDGKHEHKPAELEGKITQVNRSDRGHIISLILANDCYVDVDPRMATQLKDYLSKGKSIKISGLERIKKEGEIYERNYRIVTPQKVEVNGKEFILNK